MESIGIENEVTVNLSSSLIKGPNDQTNFSHTLLLTNTQISKTRKAFANGSSANIKFSKTQLPQMIQSGEFNFFDFLDLIDLKIYETGITLTNSEIKDIKVIKSFKNRGISLKGTTRKKY